MFDGGYYLIREPLLREGRFQHITSPGAVSDTMLDAVNLIQETPWAINTWVLDIMREAWVSGDLLGGLPSPYDDPLPGRLGDKAWEAMSKTDKAAWKYDLSKVHSTNAKVQARRKSFLSKMEIAESLRDRDAIYFPHFLDFRGRVYPMPQDLNPQGDDVSRALLQFAEGKPLGKRGIYWLAIRLANTFGMDKMTMAERVDWVATNHDLIVDSAERPLDGRRFWAEADDPWSFLVTAREWSGAEPDSISHLPIALDGTCNGLQHLSMMGLDPVGAAATNCCDLDERRDLYSDVALVIDRMIKEDALAGNAEAHAWVARGVDRKVVKRAVMTTPYGVTPRGIQDQLISDGLVTDMAGERLTNAAYMRDKIVAALSETVVAAKEIMAYFQDCASALAHHEKPMCWITPAGMEVTQGYHRLSAKRVVTLLGKVTLWEGDQSMGIDTRKQVLAAAPNVVHSFDAAHLALTALRCFRQWGITSFAFIHDSYGTYACDTDRLSQALREEAYGIYKDDQLGRFHEYLEARFPDVDLPAPPDRGTYDISEVLQARYFFA